MKNLLKSFLSLLLVAAILSSSLSCFAYSGSESLVYVSLGDSIANGTGLPANPLCGDDTVDKSLIYCNKTAGAYPVLFARKLGIADSNFYQLACSGMRTVELRRCLDPGYVIPNKNANNFQGNELEEWVLSRFDYCSLIKKADIITMNMCANDIASYALFAVREAMATAGVSTAILERLTASDVAGGEYFAALYRLLSYAANLECFARVCTAGVTAINEGYTRWTANWDAICKRIYELNPDVKLYCLGMYNPFAGMKLSAGANANVGSALDAAVAAIDSYAAVSSPYATRYTYVSIMGTESLLQEKGVYLMDADFYANMSLNVHPSLSGHSQITEKLYNAYRSSNALSMLISSVFSFTKNTAVKTLKSVNTIVTKKLRSIFRFR